MKPVRTNPIAERDPSIWWPLGIMIAVAIVAALLVVAGITSGCNADWNPPRPITPEPGNPCGLDWHSCGDGKCCYDTDVCRPGGYCAFGGLDNPTTWGASKDGGAAEYNAQTPEQIRRARGMP